MTFKHVKNVSAISIFVSSISFASHCLADTTAVYSIKADKGKETQLTIQYKDDNHVRFEISLDGNRLNSILKRPEEVYFIAPGMAMTGAQAKQMMAMTGQMVTKQPSTIDAARFKKTGESKTIAGIKGNIYELKSDGKTWHPVLSEDESVRDIRKAMAVMGDSLLSMKIGSGMASFKEFEQLKDNVILTDGRYMTLQSVEHKKLDDSLFAKPKGTEQMENMMNMLGKMKH